MPASFVEGMYLLWAQVHSNLPQGPNNLVNKWLGFSGLQSYEMALAFVGDLDERITRHILNTYI